MSRPKNRTPSEALQAVFQKISKSVLARTLDTTPQAVGQWEIAPAARVLEIEKAVNGEITRFELRPDIFGSPPTKRSTPSAGARVGG